MPRSQCYFQSCSEEDLMHALKSSTNVRAFTGLPSCDCVKKCRSSCRFTLHATSYVTVLYSIMRPKPGSSHHTASHHTVFDTEKHDLRRPTLFNGHQVPGSTTVATYLQESLGFLSQQQDGDWLTGGNMPASMRGAGPSLGMAFLSGMCSAEAVGGQVESGEEGMEVDTADDAVREEEREQRQGTALSSELVV